LSRTQNTSIILGVDIGGTKIAAGRVNERAELLSRSEVPTRSREGFEVAMNQVYAAIDAELSPEAGGIGIAAPGPLNPKTGVILNPTNLYGWRNVPLADLVAARYRLPCRVENDANAAGLAEALFGAGRGHNCVFYATLSTGIGAGIIIGGKVFHGKNGAAGEGGHITIDYRSRHVCNCGNPGCIEALASGTAIDRDGGYDLDDLAVKLSAWLGSVISLLDPDIIVLGGGVTRIVEPLFERIRRETPRRTINQFAANTPIVPAALGADCGIIGGAAPLLGVM
jgi:glucokinase